MRRAIRRAAADFALPEPALPPAAPVNASPFVETLVAGLDEVDARELDARLCRAAALERGLLARMGPLLLAFADLRGPFQLGFRGLDAYARERLGMSPRKARALLRLERACARAPVLARAWREGRITVSQAHALLPLFLAPGSELFHAAWIERTAEVTVLRLEDDVEHALVTGALDPPDSPSCPTARGIPRPSTMPSTSPRVCRPVRDPWPARRPTSGP